jgi:hypothetical protein
MRLKLLMVAIAFLTISASASAQVKCDASIGGQKIHSVYIMGEQYNGVAWAYKHIAEETCLTPTTDISKADAILELSPIVTTGAVHDQDVPVSVSCSSARGTTTCEGSDGNELTIDCSGGFCSSYYGPNPVAAAAGAFNAWISSRWFESTARMYTKDHVLLWSSEHQKGDFIGAGWPDKVRLGTNSPTCKKPRAGSFDGPKYKNYRNWGTIHCGIQFDPLVSIDIKLRNQAAAN